MSSKEQKASKDATQPQTVYAAGGVMWRETPDGKIRVLLVHRTKYKDISLPKGKVDPGETLVETAVRELKEETGIKVNLGVPLGVSKYRMGGGGLKVVHWWAAEATDDAIQASTFVPNREIAALEWVSIKKAKTRVSYPADVGILEEFERLLGQGVLRTFPIVVLRHAKASPAEGDQHDDERTLSSRGQKQASAIVPSLRAYGVKKIVASDAVRCAETVRPLSDKTRREAKLTRKLSQDAWERGKADVRGIVGKRVRARKPAVICTHLPVIADTLEELALATGTVTGPYVAEAAALEPAAFSVVHLSATNPGSGIIAIETHPPIV